MSIGVIKSRVKIIRKILLQHSSKQYILRLQHRVITNLRSMAIKLPMTKRIVMQLPGIETVIRRITSSLDLRFSLYSKWTQKFDQLDDAARSTIRAHIASLPNRPQIAVVMPVYETPEKYLRASIESVLKQIWPEWQLCIADDASPSPYIARTLMSYADNPRIKIIRRSQNGHISAATNSALNLVTADWVALLDHDDLLPEHALYRVALEILAHPEAQVIYSDEDKIDENGQRYAPYFKPDFDEDLLLGQNMISHLGVYRRDLLTRINGFREGYEGSQDHDLSLRATFVAGTTGVRHIPSVLYHWRQIGNGHSFSKSSIDKCIKNSRRAVKEHLLLKGIDAKVEAAPLIPMWHRVKFPLPSNLPLVSIIIPTRDRSDLLRTCLYGVLHKTDYPNIEVLIADNGSTTSDAIKLFTEAVTDPRVIIIPVTGDFNFPRIVNKACSKAKGEIYLLLNNDTEIIEDGWLREMVSHAIRPDIGAVGAKLIYKNGKIQHGGTVVGVGGVGAHLLTGLDRSDPGPFGMLGLLRSVSAVTGACLALRRDVWEAVGGMDEKHLAEAFNDVDLCLRIRELGLRIVWTPFAVLKHHESASRGLDTHGENALRFKAESDWMKLRWGKKLERDPYYSINYTNDDAHYQLAFPPRKYCN